MGLKYTAVVLAVMVMVATASESGTEEVIKEQVPDKASEASESWTGWAKDKISGGLGLQDKASEAKDKAYESAQSAKDKAYESAQSAKDKAYESAQSAKDKAYESAQSAKDKAYETARSESGDQTLDAAKETQSIKDHITDDEL